MSRKGASLDRAPGGRSARETALGVLVAYDRRDAYLNALLRGRLSGSGLDRRDRALVTELVQGTVRMLLAVDWALSLHSGRVLESLQPQVLWVLRLAAYQLMYTDVPDYAAVDSAAGLARAYAGERAVGFVNAVLRSLAGESDSISWPDPEADPLGYIEVFHSHPRWVVEMWSRELGPRRAESLCEADNNPGPVSLRCNLPRISRDALAEMIEREGADVAPSALAPEGLLVRGVGGVAELEGFEKGLFSVQDQGAMTVARAVEPAPGMSVLDLCAAPGGKANHLAELMENEGRVLAVDLSGSRLALVEQSARRLGNRVITTRALDATQAARQVDERFDRVLVDAPCSGLGTLARRPDVRWRRTEGDVAGLGTLQAALLREASQLVEPGGLLVYSTCTVSARENEEIIEAFLENTCDFEPAAFDRHGGQPAGGPFVQLLQDEHGCDGTFVARMRRV